MLGVHKTRFLIQHKSCQCKCGLNENARDLKKKWNRDECQCECKELDDQGSSKHDYVWNP